MGAAMVHAQNNRLIIDLSQEKKYDQTIETGKIDTLWIINKLVDSTYTYTFSVKKTRVAQPPLDFPTAAALTKSEKKALDTTRANKFIKDPCLPLKLAIAGLRSENRESRIADRIAAIEDSITDAGTTCQTQIDIARKLIGATRDLKGLAQALIMDNDETVTVKVTRTKIGTGDNAEKPKEWEFIFSTPGQRWKVFYGFTYSPDLISAEDTYFTQSMEDTTTFQVTKGRNSGNKSVYKNLTPTVMFTYMLTRKDSDFKGAAVGGVSLDLSKLSAMVGGALVIGDNLSLNAGIIFREKDRLINKYSDGQVIQEALEYDQLHEKIWQPEVFFSIGFRFSKNPFSEAKKTD